ncbi:MAG: extracellular solute-binding protein [Bauldia sp.]|nr:extracellular solute-binding protein [Bauldia sp.]
MLRFLNFVDQIDMEADVGLGTSNSNACHRMSIFLLRQHLEAKLVTVTALAASSGVPYATAMRRIDDMLAEGLCIRRPKGKGRKTFSYHPSPQLIDSWYDYARRVKRLIGRTFGFAYDGEHYDYYFGGSYLSARIVAPPSVVRSKLPIAGQLRLLVHADPTFMAMENLKRQFEQYLGASMRVRALSIDRLREEGLENSRLPKSRYDIVACDLPWIGEFAVKGVLRPLDDLVASSSINVADFHPAGWKGAFYNGHPYGVPIHTTPELLFYREDLFDEAGVTPPETTDALLAAAKVLHQPLKTGIRGIAWNAARGTPMGHTFIMILSAFGQPVLNLRKIDRDFDAERMEGEQFRPLIDTMAGRRTAEYLRELLEFSPLNILSMAWYERIAAYSRGDVAMAYGYNVLASYFELDDSSPAKGRTGILPHPAGRGGRRIAPVGGFVLGIPANLAEDRVAATWEAVRFLTSSEASKLYILNGSRTSPRFSVSADPEVRALSRSIAVVDDFERAGLVQFWPRPPAPEIAEIINICGEEMHDMARGVKSLKVALSDAQNRADRLMRSKGYY